MVHWVFPDFAFMWLVEEAKKNMPLELDFLNEGRNAEKVASMLGHFPFLKVHTHTHTLSLTHVKIRSDAGTCTDIWNVYTRDCI